jgi:hypothetical protein
MTHMAFVASLLVERLMRAGEWLQPGRRRLIEHGSRVAPQSLI